MKKIKNITIGGIQQKIFNLVLITILLMMVSYTVLMIYYYGRLTNLVHETSDSQQESIASVSEDTMTAILDTNLAQSTQMQAYIAEDLFGSV